MIYFDNSSTSLAKPRSVAAAVARAIMTFGNPGRSACDPAMAAARAVFLARREIAALVGLHNPLRVAFTSGATEGLNLALRGLIGPQDHVIATAMEHNAVLRPLYQIGCALDFLPSDERGVPRISALGGLLKHNTRFVVCTHGSNLTGGVTDVAGVSDFCRKNGLKLILDAAQTLGSIPVTADMADVIIFTGHKSLFGPQGTGGIIVREDLPFRPMKVGGTGGDSFLRQSSTDMPDVFEAGTANAHGLAGLRAGAAFVNRIGIGTIMAREAELTRAFLEGIRDIPGLRIYGSPDMPHASDPAQAARLPVVSLNLGDMPSEHVATRLWEGWRIATRAGSHCAPLAHAHFGTESQGMVRFSFGYFNVREEIDIACRALREIVGERR